MSDDKDVVLPYRTTGEELSRLLDARARGRDLSQIATLEYPAGVFQGTVTAATALGFLDPDSGALTQRGQQYALSAAHGKPALIRKAIAAFEPYGLLLEAAFAKEEAETPLEWVVRWWGTQGYGNSDTNREEGSSAFARLMEFAELGSYVPGRRGHPSRIRWTSGAPERVREPALASLPRPASAAARVAPPRASAPTSEPATTQAQPTTPAQPPVARPAPPREVNGGSDELLALPATASNSSLVLHLGPGRTVELSVPPRITASEKRRLLTLVDHMVEVLEND